MTNIIPDTDFISIIPQMILLAGVSALLWMSFLFKGLRGYFAWIAFGFCAASVLGIIIGWDHRGEFFSGMITVHTSTLVFNIVILTASALVCLLSHRAVDDKKSGEYYAILLIATLGMLVMASSNHLLVIYIGLEILSIALYILIGMNRTRLKSLEAAMKYFVLGALASAFFLYGVSLTYGATGNMDLTRIRMYLDSHNLLGHPLMLSGLGLLFAGLAFKAALIPFHMWSPDVYEGSPAPVTAFIASGPKAAVWIVIIRVFAEALPSLHNNWEPVLFVIALITMIGGNLLALIQDDIKRMLAFSGIAHAGYLLMAVIAAPVLGADLQASVTQSVFFYLTVYVLMLVLSFSVIHLMESNTGRNIRMDDLAGLATRHPFLAATLSAAMLSLAGIPITGGFVAKLMIFSVAIEAGYIALTIVAALTVLVSVYYYISVIVKMYFHTPEEETVMPKISKPTYAVLAFCTAGIILLGLLPSLIAFI